MCVSVMPYNLRKCYKFTTKCQKKETKRKNFHRILISFSCLRNENGKLYGEICFITI